MEVELVTVGDELLRGATVNTNATWLGEQLTDQGVEVTRVTVVPDRVVDIAATIDEARARSDAVIVTGGLGPTHDDRTMEAIAHSFGVGLVDHDGATEWLAESKDVDPDELAPGTVALPEGARFLPNDVGIAPGAVIKDVFVLPGVPEEMEAMFGHIAEAFVGPDFFEVVVETPQPERQIAATLAELEASFDVSVGSYPGSTVQISITGRDPAEVERAERWLRDRIDLV